MARTRTRLRRLEKVCLKMREKAQKLALQHWLKIIDPSHRYRHNLHMYYDLWFESQSSQPFFYWLNVGDGKETNLEICLRTVLHFYRANASSTLDRMVSYLLLGP